ncbi:MAG: Mur ligase family protein [Lactovum sp.]
MTHKISLKQVLNLLTEHQLLVETKNIENISDFDHISYDSSNIKENTLFFCKGIHFKLNYLEEALQKGAICYLAEKDFLENSSHARIIVTDVRLTISLIAPIFYENPAKDLNLIGITGTKGKTTVAYFLKNILDYACQKETGLMGTEETITGLRHEASHNTTPEAFDLQNFLDEARASKLPYFTMEVTSQAYKMKRVLNIAFKYAIWLNIAEDHISPAEHSNFEDYISCKLELMKNASHILINKDSDHFERILQTAKSSNLTKEIILYGSEKNKDSVNFYYHNVKREGVFQSFTVSSEKIDFNESFRISTLGLFNIENATAAIAMAKMLGINNKSIREGLIKTEIPGRMNIIENKGITAVIDYAHNLMSFSALFDSLRQDFPENKLIAIGGAPGEKAYQRRKDFADVIGKYADYTYLTAEDPQFESVQKICEEIASYMPQAQYEIIEDRQEAIQKAFERANKGDILVLLAKGTEAFQKVKGKWLDYPSDLILAKKYLAKK